MKKILPFVTKWADPEVWHNVLSEVSQTKKEILQGVTHMWNLRQSLTHRNRVYKWSLAGAAGGIRERLAKEHVFSVIRCIRSENLRQNLGAVVDDAVLYN